MKDYKMTSLEQLEVGVLVVCLLLHFMSWNSMTVDGEKILDVRPLSFGTAFVMVTMVIFALAILSKFIGRLSAFSMVVATHMAALALLANTAAKKMSGFADGVMSLSSAFGASGDVTRHVSTGGVWIFGAILAFVLLVLLMTSWGVSAYRLTKFHRRELRSGYLWSIAAYLAMIVITVLVLLGAKDLLRGAHFGGGLGGIMAGAYTAMVCGIIFFVMLLMFIINATILLLCEVLRGSNKRTMKIVSFVLGVLFLFFWMGVTSEKSQLAISMPTSIEDLVLMAGSYGGKWVLMTFVQLWFFVMAMTCILRGVYFSRREEAPAEEAAGEPAAAEAVATTESSEAPAEETASAESSEATTLFDEEEEANPNKKYYIGGGIAAAVLVAAFLLFKSCSGGGLLHGQKPSWDKFVTSTGVDAPLYKDADSNSPVLQICTENIESDAMSSYFCWSDDDVKRGYSVRPYTFSNGMISPVLEEKDGWYKVQVNDDGVVECWVQKENCREVTPTPITPEIIEKLGLSGWNRYHLVKDGKLKNLVLHSIFDELNGYSFELAELMDGVLVAPEQQRLFLGEGLGIEYMLKPDGDAYMLSYTEEQTMSDEGMMIFFDPQKLTAEQIQQLYDALVKEKPTEEKVYYYFPEVNDNHLYTFSYSLSGGNAPTLASSDSDDSDEVITDYRVVGEDGDWSLQAVLGEKSEATNINSSMRIDILYAYDFDGDGNKECIVQEDGGGSAGPDAPYIVYYDSEARKYRTTEPLETLGDSPRIETDGGQTSILFRQGIQWVRYVFEKNTLRQTENNHKDMGEAVMAVTTTMLFREDEIGKRTVECDLDEDGVAEVLTFSHDDSHASNFGKTMRLESILWGKDQSETSTDMSCERFVVLKSTEHFAHDILADNIFYRWNGRMYLPYEWNGDHFSLIENQDL